MAVLTYHVYCRVLGYITALALHSGNSVVLFFVLQSDVVKDDRIRIMKETQFRYITIWNVAFQLLFATIGLIGDLPIIFKVKEEYKCIQYVRSYKKIYYASVIFPIAVLIFSIFWPVFIYDRGLIFPAYIDQAVSLTSNHIMHTSILPIALWELFFQPRSKPSSHKWYLLHVALVYISYIAALFSNYAKRGIWPYPFLKMIYGTPYFPILFICIAVSYLLLYFIQWPITAMIFEKFIKSEKKS